MKTILVLGAGFSSRSLIDYLLQNAVESNWKILVGDINQARADAAIGNHPAGKAVKFDVHNDHDLKTYIAKADLVVSMLPARFHPLVAAHCLTEKTNLLTASYLSPEMRQMDKQARERNILFINELGLDPGIDHMSAIRILQHIRENGGTPVSFKSYTGGLIAPESDNNPWNYKFTWNPRNVVLAGQGCASFIENSQIRYIPYQQLFKRTQLTEISGAGTFEVYPNRNSLIYRTIYNLPDIPTLIRGTLRRPGFCEAWDVFVQLGMTDDSCHLEGSENLTARRFINTFLPGPENEPVQSKLSRQFNLQPEGAVMKKLAWLGLFDEEPVGLPNATPAQILQK
ncbi:MAG: saccharopine dehydrogenase NADP-binding domain-containing protein, partial [Bacteroidales bacterium]|nr:saccharopine dehydrogenase NADP-binding domain-containing protein [Bacteroidales bacterium]